MTVQGVTSETIDIATHVTFKDGYNWETILPYVNQAVDDYFAELSAGWDKVDWRTEPDATLIVRISQLETRLLNVAGVLDIADTTLNGEAANYACGVNGIPLRGAVTNG